MSLQMKYTSDSKEIYLPRNTKMHFIPDEERALLEVKGVGSVILKRFEEIRIYSL